MWTSRPRYAVETVVRTEATENARSGCAPLSVIHSVVSAATLEQHVRDAYWIGTAGSCRLLQSGLDDTYLLTTPDMRYIARVYNAARWSANEIAYELELLAHLAAKRVSVATAIRTRDGRLMFPLATPEGTRQVALFAYVSGTSMTSDDPDQCYLSGRLLAEFHSASDDFVSGYQRPSLDLINLIDIPVDSIRPFLAHRPVDLAFLETVAAKLKACTAAAAGARLNWGVCHGDFGTKNILVGTDGGLTLLDFEYCGPGWRAYDFVSIRRAAEHSRWTSFLRGYNDVRPVAAIDLQAVPLFLVLRHLFMLGIFARNVGEWGTLRLEDRSLDRSLKVLRNWDESSTSPLLPGGCR